MQTLLQDLRYSLRQLIKSPGFTLTALVSLAQDRGLPVARCAALVVAAVDGKAS